MVFRQYKLLKEMLKLQLRDQSVHIWEIGKLWGLRGQVSPEKKSEWNKFITFYLIIAIIFAVIIGFVVYYWSIAYFSEGMLSGTINSVLS